MQLREGFSGKIARIFVNSKLTPVIAIASVLIGVAAVFLTPKEEEPQISVPMIDIMTGAPGYSPEEVERKVSETIERAVWGLEGVEYVYSTSMANQSIVTVRYKVGEPMEPSIVKIHHKLQEVKALLPANVTPSMVKSFSIDDVPFLVLSFSSSVTDDFSLRTLVAPLARELSSTPDLSRVELLGGRKRAIRIIVDPDRLAARGTSLLEVAKALKASDAYAPVGKNWGEDKVYDVEVGGRIRSADDIQDIAVAQKGGVPVRIRDVATVTDGPEERVRSSVLIRQQKSGGEIQASDPERAVSIVFAKRKGTNVVILAKELMERAQIFSKALPSDVKLSVLRNYGDTAFEKS
ncbi:MAG TPA: AcrB/AcrD/AcrF family protein, partial [Bdellovibrionales bacterium]|nr:AcrB/AcrD/AcrF family protein [Bdellovibrionales bacterium]